MPLGYIPLLVVLTPVVLALWIFWLWRRHTVNQMLTKLPLDLAHCVCGRAIRSCDHGFGVPSTWQHLNDRTHFHPDGTMVEHA